MQINQPQNDESLSSLGQEMRYLRQKQKITLAQMAERLGYAKSHLSNVENGVTRPSRELVEGYEKECNVEPGQLLKKWAGAFASQGPLRYRVPILGKVIDSSQVTILERGAEAWNQWRKEHSSEKVDLRSVDLSKAILRGADFSDANLSGAYFGRSDLREVNFSRASLYNADLSGADLRNANLSFAFLVIANLTEANLTGTDLHRADITKANLSNANLRNVDLTEANLTGADLRGATLTGANLSRSTFYDTNLRDVDLNSADLTNAIFQATALINIDFQDVYGLETIWHHGPSEISTSTLYHSRGQIPDIFLRGCGIADEMIDYVHSIAGAIQYYTVFISYNHQDTVFVQRLYNDLQKAGIRCWKYTEDMPIGGDIYQKIYDQIIRIYDKVLVVLSENSIDSDWVRDEVEMGIEKEKQRNKTTLFPIHIDDAYKTTPHAWARRIRRRLDIGDFTNWEDPDAYQAALQKLLRALEATDSPHR